MLRAVIVDNEQPCIAELERALSQYCPEVVVTGSWRNLPDAVHGIAEAQPDIVFMDVELDGGVTGFDVLEEIHNRGFEVIFVTAYNQYAARAFHFSATHYIEKPVDGSLLREAIGRVKQRRSENDFKLQIQVLAESMKNLASQPRQIILPNPKQGDSIVLPVQDIIRVEASGSQAVFVIKWEGKMTKTMYSLNIGTLQKKMLQGYDDFIMIHESHIVNRNHITHYNTNGTFIRVAERRVNEFLEKFNR
jgi:two-component system LytT family response regulator